MDQRAVDERNAEFWNMLSGWSLARAAGVDPARDDDLDRFDREYLAFYPYLAHYVEADRLRGQKVLEIGLGFGTLGRLLSATGCEYHGVDIAPEPVALMRRRLRDVPGAADRIVQGSALDLPFPDGAFAAVYSIGCLHHTGDLERSVAEVRRVLAPGGSAIVMLYYRHSLRRLAADARGVLRRHDRRRAGERLRARYDADPSGAGAPHTDFVSRRDVRRLFRDFRTVQVEIQNFDDYRFVRRRWLLGNVARVAGLDVYVSAVR